MLATFTTKDGLLVIRSEDLRVIEDVRYEPSKEAVCFVRWLPNDSDLQERLVLGTAQENLDRITANEARQLAAYAEMQARTQQGLPALPIVRGGKVRP